MNLKLTRNNTRGVFIRSSFTSKRGVSLDVDCSIKHVTTINHRPQCTVFSIDNPRDNKLNTMKMSRMMLSPLKTPHNDPATVDDRKTLAVSDQYQRTMSHPYSS